jgi:hypothetical protein
MAGSFTISNPAQKQHWRRVAIAFGLLTLESLLVLAGLIVRLVQQRRRAT